MRASEFENELKKRDDTIQRLTERIGQLEAEMEELKKLLTGKAEAKTAKKPKFTQNYSLDKNKRKKHRRTKSTGRRSNDAKRDLIEHQYDIFWADADRQQCIFHREQFAWRLIDGRAVYVGYNIHDLPDSKELPLPTGLRNSRSEYGIEVILTLAFLHYWIGVSIDNARELEEAVRLLCTRQGETIEKNVTPECEATFIRLQNELFNNLDRLFVFVERPEVEPTNNRSERNVRREAEIRKGGRTSKTPAGAKRRGVIMTVMASLQTRFAKFTLDSLLSEVHRWLAEGRSIFESELGELQDSNASPAAEPAICLSG